MVSGQLNNCSQLNELLQEQDRNFPARLPSISNQVETELALVVDYFENQRGSLQWQPDEELTRLASKMEDGAVFLCGSMKSGTTLLLELLDGHSQLNVLPGDSWLWVRFSEKAKNEIFSIEEWRNHWLRRFVNPTGQAPFWVFGDDHRDYSIFLEYMDYWFATLPDASRRPALTTVLSYFCANPKRSLSAEQWVEKTPGNEFRIDSIVSNFPRAKFIHIVRDPRENLASIKRLYYSRSWKWEARSIARSLADSYETAYENQEKLGKTNYLVVRYEDLTSNPGELMQEIAGFLQIGWEDSLLCPTINNRLAKANSMYKDRQATGVVRRSQADKWRSELTVFEQGVVHQTRAQARKVGLNWEIKGFDLLKKLIFGWTIKGISPGSWRATDSKI